MQLRHELIRLTMRSVLVGRETELRLLSTLLAEGRRPVLYGEAGVGKTALARAIAPACGRRLLEAGALGTLSWLPYLPLRRLLGHDPLGADAAHVAREVDEAVGAGILLLDDLHWADRDTREAIALLPPHVSTIVAVRRGDPGAADVLGELGRHGYELVPVEPLPAETAARLVASIRPGLTRAEIGSLVRRTGGNPLLIEELTAVGGPSESLRLSLAARLRLLTDAGRDAMGLLALAGRPVDQSLVGEGAGELVAAGLATLDGELRVRHALLAETAAAQLDVADRKRLHAHLARALPDPGESARHYAAAGEHEVAVEQALRAAENAGRPGEVAAHLALAASFARGPDAVALRMRAAAALIDGNEYAAAEGLLAEVACSEPLSQAEVWRLRFQAREHAGDRPGARDAWAAGMRLAGGSGSAIEVRLLIDEARMAYLFDDNFEAAVSISETALRRAYEVRAHVPAALGVRGSAAAFAREPGWPERLRKAIAAARQARDLDTEFRSGNNLVLGLQHEGRFAEARRTAVTLAGRARRARVAAWESRMRTWLVSIDWYRGFPRDAAEEATFLLRQVLEPADRRFLDPVAQQAFIDLGRYDEARSLIEKALEELEREQAPDDELSDVLWARTDLELAAGRPLAAVTSADECLARCGDGEWEETAVTFVTLTHAWASLDLGRPSLVELVPPRRSLLAPAAFELDALRLAAGGEHAQAALVFARAARAWERRYFRSHLRCLWGQAESLRRAGKVERGRVVLEAAEQRALERGYQSLLGRIQRSLRLMGARRSAPRSDGAGGLTGREHEVLALAAAGLSNGEIARRLGIGRPTVQRFVSSACAKLGATTRAQAAALANRA